MPGKAPGRDRDIPRDQLAIELLEARRDPVPVPWKVLELRYQMGRTQLTKIWRAAGGKPKSDGRRRKKPVYLSEIKGRKKKMFSEHLGA